MNEGQQHNIKKNVLKIQRISLNRWDYLLERMKLVRGHIIVCKQKKTKFEKYHWMVERISKNITRRMIRIPLLVIKVG